MNGASDLSRVPVGAGSRLQYPQGSTPTPPPPEALPPRRPGRAREVQARSSAAPRIAPPVCTAPGHGDGTRGRRTARHPWPRPWRVPEVQPRPRPSGVRARVTAAGPPAAPRAQRPILPAPRGELRGGGWGGLDSSAPRASRPARAGPRVAPLPAPRAARRGRSAPRPRRAAPARALVLGPALRSLQLRARLGSCSRGSPGSCGNWDHVGSTLLPQPGTCQVRNPGIPAATARAPRRPR